MYIQPTIKKYLLLLKDSLKPYKTKFINTWLQYVYNDKLDGVVNKYNNTYHQTIKMKPADVKSMQILILVTKIMRKILNLKLVKSKYEIIFAKIFTPNSSEEVFVIKNVKSTVPWTSVINLCGEEIVGTFYEKKLQKN